MKGRSGPGRAFSRAPACCSHASAPKQSAIMLALLALSFAGQPVLAHPVSTGPTTISVRDKGAIGDGVHDDTAAIQAAIDGLPASGGTVTISPGNYKIDATRAINLRSNMLLKMAPSAQLSAIENNLPRSHVIKVWNVSNVQITGGRIVGERSIHTGSGGEWGYGLNIESSDNVTVSDLQISDCWGDGIWIGALGPDGHARAATNVTLDRVTSTNNRRQGLSIGPVNGVKVLNSTFGNSNGTKPEAGIDIEPQAQGLAQNIVISRSVITGNHGTGFEMHDNVSDVTVSNCTIQDNDGYGVLIAGTTRVYITDNTVNRNGLVGLTIAGKTSRVRVTGNTLTDNSARYARRFASAITSKDTTYSSRDLRVDGSTQDIAVSKNTSSP